MSETVQLVGNREHRAVAEAELFFGFYRRGHSLDRLRREIDVPDYVVEEWSADWEMEGWFRQYVEAIYIFRKQVLAIFDALVAREAAQAVSLKSANERENV